MANDYFQASSWTRLVADSVARSALVNAIIDAVVAGFDVLGERVGFMAWNTVTDANATGDGTAVTVDYDNEAFDQGADFAADTFTAPVTGKYQFDVGVLLTSVGSAHTVAIVDLITTSRQVRLWQGNPYALYDATNGAVALGGGALVDMTAADTAYVQVTVSGGAKTVGIYGSVGQPRTRFSGFKVF